MTQGHAQHLCSGCISSTTMASCAVFGRRASVVSERVISKLCQEVHSRPQRQPSVLRLVGQCSEAPQHMAQHHRHLRPPQPLAARQLLAAAPLVPHLLLSGPQLRPLAVQRPLRLAPPPLSAPKQVWCKR